VARATGKKTVAEGIETEEVAAMLRTFGVDYGQGYLWHTPEPLATLLDPPRSPQLRLSRAA
jgi:EAL domain-containing protein (putative c-di-GMP-specific phosphodiesterase class I)